MKILVINWQDRLNPQAGGAEEHLHQVFGRLAKNGHEVTLLVSGWKYAPQLETIDGMAVHRTGTRYSFSLAAPIYYRRAWAPGHFDLIVEDLNKIPLATPLWARAPVVLLVHHLFGRVALRALPAPIALLTIALERLLLPLYRGLPVQAVSESTARDLVARGLRAEDITVIRNGVDVSYVQCPAPEEPTDPYMLFLGRLERYKGVDQILHAMAETSGD